MRKGKRDRVIFIGHAYHGGQPLWRKRLATALISGAAGFLAGMGMFMPL